MRFILGLLVGLAGFPLVGISVLTLYGGSLRVCPARFAGDWSFVLGPAEMPARCESPQNIGETRP